MRAPKVRRVPVFTHRLRLAWLTSILFLPQCPALAADLTFSGSLERVGHESISIRLADRRLIDVRLPSTPLLSPAKIAKQYNFGDQVQITCKPIQQTWEEDTARLQFLELTKLRFVRRSTADELSKMLALPMSREGENLLALPDATRSTARAGAEIPATNTSEDDKLASARKVNLEYAANMPNFVADETGKRYVGDTKSQQWRVLDTIETEITFKGSRAVRARIRKDGEPWEQPFQALPGFKWYGGFGTEIEPVFNPQCPTTIEYQGHEEVRGKRLLKYRFSSPADGCFGPFTMEYQRYNPARTGHVFVEDIDGKGGNVIQFDEETAGFPAGFGLANRREEVSWDYVKIGDATHLLPIGANFEVAYSNGNRARVDVEYKNHRHFEASTNITFH